MRQDDDHPDLRDLRGPLPLTDADFTRIRAQVMATVRERRRPALAWRFAFALVTLVVAGGVLWQSLRAPKQPAGTAPVVASAPQRPPQPATAPAVEPSRSIAPPVALPPASTRPAVLAEAVARQPEGPRQPAPAPAVTAEAAPEIRLEIQTSDPDVRIIWIANQTYEPKPYTLEESS